jgi:putative acetyltransferase
MHTQPHQHTVDLLWANAQQDWQQLAEIFGEYVQSTQTDLSFQSPQTEFARLPGDYAAPKGAGLMVQVSGELVGCAALRPIDTLTAELKRVYIKPSHRGMGLGRLVVNTMIACAQSKGYRWLCLDVLAEFQAAQALYTDLGFIDGPARTFNPVPGTRFMSRAL